MKIQTIHKLKMPYSKKIKGINWVLNRFVRLMENYLIRRADVMGCIKDRHSSEQVIVSMTTYPARTEKVVWTIKSLMNQSVTIDKFILWLAEEQYPDHKVPSVVKQYEKYGLEIRFCENLRSHKKYYYTMLENPDAIVITVDDDVIYPENTVEKLLEMHKKFPGSVICNQARWIRRTKSGIMRYRTWPVCLPKGIRHPEYNILPIGEGGILYPPHSLDTEVFNKNKIEDIASSADDLWLKFMEVKNGTKAMVATKEQRGLCEVKVSSGENSSLHSQNVEGGGNDEVIIKLSKLYPEAVEKFSLE